MRTCHQCGMSLDHKRAGALYCDRSCKNKAADKRRYARNPDRDRLRYDGEAEVRRAGAKRYYHENQEQQVLYSRNYRHSNRQVRAAQASRRKALILASDPIPITAREWRRLKARYRGCCAYCGRSAVLQMDHVLPLARGGRHAPSNILPACAPCNTSKRDHLLSEWRLRPRGGTPTPWPE